MPENPASDRVAADHRDTKRLREAADYVARVLATEQSPGGDADAEIGPCLDRLQAAVQQRTGLHLTVPWVGNPDSAWGKRRARQRHRPSPAELERALSLQPVSEFPKIRDAGEFEPLPSIADIFDELCVLASGYPPTADSFVERCRAACAREYANYLQPERWPGIEARLRRAHPSFVRERHLAVLLADAGVACIRNVSMDMQHGADLVIVHGAYAVRLATFVDTPEGRRQWVRKTAVVVPDAILIGLPLEKNHCAEVGGYWLYTRDHVNLIISNVPSAIRGGPGLYELSIKTRPAFQRFRRDAI